jgi:carbon-monoxide dehydrogenase medium subunit
MKYHLPGSMQEYEELTGSMGESTCSILAGGTDLIPRFEEGQPLPEHLINVKAIPELSGIQQNTQQVEIGALTSIETLRRDAHIHSHFPALAQACEDFGSVQIRHRATLGGCRRYSTGPFHLQRGGEAAGNARRADCACAGFHPQSGRG